MKKSSIRFPKQEALYRSIEKWLTLPCEGGFAYSLLVGEVGVGKSYVLSDVADDYNSGLNEWICLNSFEAFEAWFKQEKRNLKDDSVNEVQQYIISFDFIKDELELLTIFSQLEDLVDLKADSIDYRFIAVINEDLLEIENFRESLNSYQIKYFVTELETNEALNAYALSIGLSASVSRNISQSSGGNLAKFFNLVRAVQEDALDGLEALILKRFESISDVEKQRLLTYTYLNESARDGAECLLGHVLSKSQWRQDLKLFQEVLSMFSSYYSEAEQRIFAFRRFLQKHYNLKEVEPRRIDGWRMVEDNFPDVHHRKMISYFAPLNYFNEALIKELYPDEALGLIRFINLEGSKYFDRTSTSIVISSGYQSAFLRYIEMYPEGKDSSIIRQKAENIWANEQKILEEQIGRLKTEISETEEEAAELKQRLDKMPDVKVVQPRRNVARKQLRRKMRSREKIGSIARRGPLFLGVFGILLFYMGVIVNDSFAVIYYVIGILSLVVSVVSMTTGEVRRRRAIVSEPANRSKESQDKPTIRTSDLEKKIAKLKYEQRRASLKSKKMLYDKLETKLSESYVF